MKAQSEKKHGSDKEERGKLPESPKTAEEIWQQSVIGDYLARFKVRSGLGRQLGSSLPAAGIPSRLLSCCHSRSDSAGGGGQDGAQQESGCPVVHGGASGSTWVSWAHLMRRFVPQNDRGKALKAMEATWNNMEKKEKLMWIKKAAEDQKRYEVGPCSFDPALCPCHQHCPVSLTPLSSSGSEGAE